MNGPTSGLIPALTCGGNGLDQYKLSLLGTPSPKTDSPVTNCRMPTFFGPHLALVGLRNAVLYDNFGIE